MFEFWLGIDVGGGGKSKDFELFFFEYIEFVVEFWVLFLCFSFFFWLKSDLLKNCMFLGWFFDGMLFDVDWFDDFCDNVLVLRIFFYEGLFVEVRDCNEDELEEWFWCLFWIDVCCICLWIFFGDGGVLMVGLRKFFRFWFMGMLIWF